MRATFVINLLALAGLTPLRLARMRARAAEAGVTDLRLANAAGAWLELMTDAPIAPADATALADALTAATNRPVHVVRLSDVAAGERAAAWALAVPL